MTMTVYSTRRRLNAMQCNECIMDDGSANFPPMTREGAATHESCFGRNNSSHLKYSSTVTISHNNHRLLAPFGLYFPYLPRQSSTTLSLSRLLHLSVSVHLFPPPLTHPHLAHPLPTWRTKTPSNPTLPNPSPRDQRKHNPPPEMQPPHQPLKATRAPRRTL